MTRNVCCFVTRYRERYGHTPQNPRTVQAIIDGPLTRVMRADMPLAYITIRDIEAAGRLVIYDDLGATDTRDPRGNNAVYVDTVTGNVYVAYHLDRVRPDLVVDVLIDQLRKRSEHHRIPEWHGAR